MLFYRQNFSGQVLPKHHILEQHVVPWIEKWGFGMGLLGEQGGESLHATFNTLQENSRGIQNNLDRLMSVMREHHMAISPFILEAALHPIPRKLKKIKRLT